MIHSRTSNQNIVDNGEDTFTSDPGAILVFDATVIQDSGFVEFDASSMYLFGENYLIFVEVVPARLTLDLVW